MSTASTPEIVESDASGHFIRYLREESRSPLLLCGDSLEILSQLPSESIDFAMTSPPYWGKREYENGGIGLEKDCREYIRNLTSVIGELHRVMKATGSFWLNIGDTYRGKSLLGIPWRVALELTDVQGWTLRNEVIWNKVKGGPDNASDKLRNVHEHVFHFTKNSKGYYYNADAIRSTPKKATVKNGAVVSATGVSGVRYRRQIELSTELTEAEKKSAFQALDEILLKVTRNELADFRMVIRKQQRSTHSDSISLSGRAKELAQKGFYFLRYHPNGSKPSDVWDIIPEDTQNRKHHYAAYPEDLCRLPILATCPETGVVLDPFCGTGTTLAVAQNLGRRAVGIDISKEYLKMTAERTLGRLF
jgi:DNA modification methylase